MLGRSNDRTQGAPLWRSVKTTMLFQSNGGPKRAHARASILEIFAQVRFFALELGATVVFLVWLYHEVLHEIR